MWNDWHAVRFCTSKKGAGMPLAGARQSAAAWCNWKNDACELDPANLVIAPQTMLSIYPFSHVITSLFFCVFTTQRDNTIHAMFCRQVFFGRASLKVILKLNVVTRTGFWRQCLSMCFPQISIVQLIFSIGMHAVVSKSKCTYIYIDPTASLHGMLFIQANNDDGATK